MKKSIALNQRDIRRQIARYEVIASEYIVNNKKVPNEILNKLMYYDLLINTNTSAGEQLNGLGAPYIPASEGPRLNVEVPDKMNDETHEIISKIDSEVGGIDEYVRKKLGFKSISDMYTNMESFRGLSAEQIDAIAMAIYNIEAKNQMMIVSDQTGIGKGRIAAAIMRYAHQIGKKPIFITIRANLFSDIYRDLFDLYADDLTPVKQVQKDENGNILQKVIRRSNPDTGEVTETRNPLYKPIKNPKFGKQLRPFILNNKGTEDPSIKSKDGDIIYEVPVGAERKAEYERVVENHNYAGYDCFLMTYSQFKDNNSKKIQFLNDIIKDNIIILDESHEAGGVDSNTGNAIRNALATGKPLGGLFLSATFAKEPKNMPIYAATTSMKYAGLSTDQFVFAMQQGGNALQEIISAELAQSGCFIRRERPLSNVKFNYITLDSKGHELFNVPDKEIEHCAIFDNITSILKNIIKFQVNYINPYLREKADAENEVRGSSQSNKETLSYKNDPIFNRLFQIVNQSVFSLKAEQVAERAIQRMKNGEKPVITFENTMDTWLDRLLEMYGQGNIAYTDFSIVMKKGLETALEYQEIKTIVTETTDENGNIKEERVPIVTDGVIDPEKDLTRSGMEVYFDLLDKINDTSFGISVAPIDIIKTRIKQAGFTVGEITGRKQEVHFVDNNMNKGHIKPRKKENTNDTVNGFQTNRIDCILLNQAGSTGISLHAERRKPDVHVVHAVAPTSLLPRSEVKKRVMIVSQPNLDINKMVQTWGRINRSGQVYRPEYDFVTLAVPAEMRLMLFLQRKLRSLDANTTSNQKQNESVLNLEDFLNEYGDQIVESWLNENEDLNYEMGEPLWKKVSWHTDIKSANVRYNEKGVAEYYYDATDAAKVVTGRVALLKTSDQRKFYTEVNDRYKSLVTQKKNEGTYNLEVEFLPLNAVTKNSKVYMMGTDDDNPFAASTIIEECEVDVLSKPYTSNELNNLIQSTLDDTTVGEYTADLLRRSSDYFAKREADYRKSISDKWEQQIGDIQDKAKIKKILKDEGKDAWRAAIQKMTEDFQLAKIDEINHRLADLDAQKAGIQVLFKSFLPGNGYVLNTGEMVRKVDGNVSVQTTDSVFVGFIIDESKSNPWAPSNITLRFATSVGAKFKDYQPTAKGGREVIEATLQTTKFYRGELNFLQRWDDLTKSENSDRETRYIITGNLLQAYKGNIIGKLVSFTYADGSMKKGLLLPKSYTEDMNTTVPIIYAKRIIENLSNYEKLSTNTVNGNSEVFDGITFVRERWNYRYKIIVGNTAKNGAQFYKNNSILNLLTDTYSGFKQEKGTMVAYIEFDNLSKLLHVLNTEFVPPISIKLNAEQVKAIKEDMPEFKKRKPDEKVSKIIKFEAKYLTLLPMKQVAGIPGTTLSKNDQRELDKLNALIKKTKRNKTLKGVSGGNKYNIDLDKLNI